MSTQLKKGTIELAILKILNEEDSYGYEIGKFISSKINVNEGTIYLILQRLEKSGDLEIYFKKVNGSKQRKYYKLCDQGKEKLDELTKEWEQITNFIENCTVVEENDE